MAWHAYCCDLVFLFLAFLGLVMLTGPGPNELGSKMGEVVEETGG